MCIEKNAEDFSTIHHELGHIFIIKHMHISHLFFKVGQMMASMRQWVISVLSITPNYLQKIGFVSEEEAESAKENGIAFLMKQALDGLFLLHGP